MSSLQDKILAAALQAPRIPVLALDRDEERLSAAVREIRSCDPAAEDLTEAERTLLRAEDPPPLGPVLALKLARSQLAVAALPSGATVRIMFPMFKEIRRLQPYGQNPEGEDLIHNKIRQLGALFADSRAAWCLAAVDDGCPDGSGAMARDILQRDYPALLDEGRATVLLLEEAIARGEPEAIGIADAGASRKGGSILYGLRWMQRRAAAEDVLLYTDADLSTHLGQAGLLAGPIASGAADVVAGSRREPDSIQIKSASRSSRGRLFIHLWKRMLPPLSEIIDSQASFKAFRAGSIATVLEEAGETGFAVDLELLLLCRVRGLRIGKAGICFIDSEAESATAGQEVHLTMLRTVAALRRRHLPADESADAITGMVESLDMDSWLDLVRNPPAPILETPLDRLGDPSLM